ncbi:Xylose isomerase domain protein TIM barrel [Candidatus Puniceispirillum marinum IMCC1322]|uniref:Xylose isomerase domain protein TIM barrel n=2 Tax=Candidatus Puniceispirillum TaxID=767891 RepID=D5BSC3_PUNMI|nr:Xylose isomerase domain protein TIM barrel [Candidatus Puniceispirillum marinum IMCC1322]
MSPAGGQHGNAMRTLTKADLCIHQVCLVEQCDFASSLDVLARNQIGKTAVWRPMLEAVGTKTARKMLDDSGVQAHALCALELLKGIEDGTRMLDIAASIGAKSVVAITGGFDADNTTLADARHNAIDMLAKLLPIAQSYNITIALEPLHPMVCGLRSVISSLREANDILDQLDSSDNVGIALDSYAVWWEPDLMTQISRAGNRIVNYHVADWLAETRDIRLDRGMPGEGIIALPALRDAVEATGFTGPVEVEIFSTLTWWQAEPQHVVDEILARINRYF